jgi:hypothetical protein
MSIYSVRRRVASLLLEAFRSPLLYLLFPTSMPMEGTALDFVDEMTSRTVDDFDID